MAEHVKNLVGAVDLSFERRAPRQPEKQFTCLDATVTAANAVGTVISGGRPEASAVLARERRGWGAKYQPPIEDADSRREFKRICEDIIAEAMQLRMHLVGGVLAEEATGVQAEIQHLLEKLYDCPFGEGESLKSIVVALQSQLNNTRWTAQHVAFLEAALQHLRMRWIINDQIVEEINDLIEEHELDVFRGTVSDADVVTRYRIEKI